MSLTCLDDSDLVYKLLALRGDTIGSFHFEIFQDDAMLMKQQLLLELLLPEYVYASPTGILLINS